MMKYSRYKPNVLVIRKFYNTHRNSTRAQLCWAIEKLGVRDLWRIPRGENTLTFLPTGQQILFRGMDDPQSITSITVASGYLCWVWIEEAYQITKEDDFNKLDMSIRGQLPDGLYHQFILTFNPWSDRHWLKARFFDNPDENTMSLTTNYMINEFLSQDDKRLYEIMKERYPRRYRIEGLGEWGVAEGLVYGNWEEKDFEIKDIFRKANGNVVSCNGMDFGYNDPTAFVGAWCDRTNYIIYIYYEFYAVTMENKAIAAELIEAGFRNAKILADSEDPRTINELQKLGLSGLRGARKGAGSVLGGIQKLQDYRIVISPKCPHAIEAFSNYAWKKDRISSVATNTPEHDFSHIPDALRYGCEDLENSRLLAGRVAGV